MDNTSLSPETPLSPIAHTPDVELTESADEYVRRVMVRLEGLGADERFRSVKRGLIQRSPPRLLPDSLFRTAVARLLRDIALAETARRPAQLTRGLILEMADMLSAVLKIRTVEDLTLVTDTGESIVTRVQALMVQIERDVKDCTRLIKSYHSSIGEYRGIKFVSPADPDTSL